MKITEILVTYTNIIKFMSDSEPVEFSCQWQFSNLIIRRIFFYFFVVVHYIYIFAFFFEEVVHKILSINVTNFTWKAQKKSFYCFA